MGVVLNFDARTVQPSTGQQDAIPAGWYNVVIDDSEMKPTKDTTGAMLVLSFKVLDGQFAGRKLFSRLNLRNNNAQAVEIAYKDLSAICHAVGVMQVQDSAELHAKPMKVKVSLRPARQERNDATGEVTNYEASNDIKAYKNINEQVGGAPAGSPPAGFGVPAGFGAQAPQQAPAFAAQAPQAAAPAPAPQAPAWQAPAAAQPWAAAPAPAATVAPVQQQAPAPVQQAAPQPPFIQQPAAAPAQGGQPAWMAGAPAAAGQPAWAQQPAAQ